MKKIFNFVILAVAAVLAVTGCQKEMDVRSESEARTVSFYAGEVDTRTQFGDKVDGKYPALWTANQQVLVNLSYGKGLALDVTPSPDGTTATFQGDFSAVTEGPYTFMSVSPQSAKCINFNKETRSVGVNILAMQTPLANSVDERVQILVAKSETTDEFPESADLHYSHLVAYGKLTLTDFDLADDEEVASIVLTASEVFAGKYLYYFDDTVIDGVETPQGTLRLAESPSNTITLTTSSVEDVWFACAPVDLSNGGKLKIVVNTSKGAYTKEVTFSETTGKFEAGKVASFPVSMAGVEPMTSSSWVKVNEAPADWSGTYLVAVVEFEPNNPRAWTQAFANSNRFFLTTADNNNIITAASMTKGGASIPMEDLLTKYSITIAGTTGGYSIRLADGKYMTKTATGPGIDVSDTEVIGATEIDFKTDDNTVMFHLSTVDVGFGFNPTNGNNRFNYFPDVNWSDKKRISLYKYVDAGQPEDQPQVQENITLTAELNAAGTSAGYEEYPMFWKNGDAISLYSPQSGTWQSEDIAFDGLSGQSSSHQFSYSFMTWGDSEEYDFYAVYPARKFGPRLSVNLSIPSMQMAGESVSDDLSAMPMLAMSKGLSPAGEGQTLSFSPAFSALDIRFSVTEDVTISRITVSSTDGTPVAGDYVASAQGSEWVYDFPSNMAGRSSVMALQTAGTEGLSLSAGEEAHFIAFVLPQDYAGLNVDLLTADGKVYNHRIEDFTAGKLQVNLGTLPASSSWGTTYGSWMKYVPDNVLVSDLSVPGSHDAATSSVSMDTGKCQSMGLAAQLAGGVRLFDLRPSGDNLEIMHSILSTGITLEQALGSLRDYLVANPTEGCIVFMMKEGDTWNKDLVSPTLGIYADNMVNYTAKLTVGALRGKILVISRTTYPGTIYGGFFNKAWPDNTPGEKLGIGHKTNTKTEEFYLQDQYDSSTSIDTKFASFQSCAEIARNNKAVDSWVCNHVSLAATIFGTPKNNAVKLNPKAVEYINGNPGRLGLVMMDYACDTSAGGAALVNAVINQNVRYVQGVK